MAYVDEEIASQPECWLRAAAYAKELTDALPQPGERVAVTGCGTSWFMAMAYAQLREAAGQGETDAFAGSEFPVGRTYDRVIAITRSGTTSEILDLIPKLSAPVTVIIGDPDSPVVALATHVIAMPWADEKSVVQTRFATSALALLRSGLGENLSAASADAEAAVRCPLPLDPAKIEQITFLGRGWTVGLAHEAALKCREAATFWTEAYPAMDFRHGPIAIAAPGRAVWAFGDLPAGLADDVEATGASFVHSRYNCEGHPALDPMADLIMAQRFAVALALHRGLDPDAPRNLTRSVILPAAKGMLDR
ncbi:fructoselysine-6-P-deglycase FrlB-like protein [Allocatelliglobosispora scoriae]|uniref:Fructoselysine-6-P-deglycase FrlB-like protein n=1 Tax=Allocatelliglobosispora scoriae TaxID=643052 RepID=A0A841BV98_9ACTN|nr:sugar isomerase [Allocatelliglobosispora scoriae]MBB5870682.1 fructoselysine-6-P-deglycase FrlB-like protein [Allocatelliglobosispora scoriae]